MGKGASTEQVVREIHRRTRRRFSAEEKVRIVLEGLRGEQSVAELCRREGLSPNLYYRWSKEFLEAGSSDTPAHGRAGPSQGVGDTTIVCDPSALRELCTRLAGKVAQAAGAGPGNTLDDLAQLASEANGCTEGDVDA